eukprot:5886571-Prymnesium_polylepis.1
MHALVALGSGRVEACARWMSSCVSTKRPKMEKEMCSCSQKKRMRSTQINRKELSAARGMKTCTTLTRAPARK